MSTIIDVAKTAGVSTATVSRVINSPDQVNATMREAVEAAIAQLNYRPNKAARALKRQASQTVGVVLNRFSSPYFGYLLEGIEDALFDQKFKTIAESGRETEETQIAAWMSLVERQCESFIVHADAVSEDALSALMEQHPATVLINRKLHGFEQRCIALDNYTAGRNAATFLVEKGHRTFAVLTGPMNRSEAFDRQSGFVDGLKEAGITLHPEVVAEGWFTDAQAQEIVTGFLECEQTFTAIFAQNDIMAAGTIAACRAKGLRVPEDISVMGFDDLSLAQYLTPKLTTIRQPVQSIGAAAGLMAHRLVRPDVSHDRIPTEFHGEIIERDSVAVLNSA